MKRKLDEIVREYMIESLGATQIDQRYSRLLQIAISGLRNLNMDVNGITKIERISIDSQNFIASLPNDYINYKKLFVCNGGQQLGLAINENMCPPDYDSCGDMTVEGTQDTVPNSDGWFYPFATNVPFDGYGSFTGRQYGIGGGNNGIGTFKIYPNDGYIALQNINQSFDEIIMEYLADIDYVDGNTMVHPYDVEAVKAWMYWKYIQRSEKYPMGEKQIAERAYGKEKLKARKRHNSFNIIDLMSAVRSGFMSAPKI